jgi:hypothetical protein
MVQTSELDDAMIARLRQMARQGYSPVLLFRELKACLGSNSIAPIIEYMRGGIPLERTRSETDSGTDAHRRARSHG